MEVIPELMSWLDSRMRVVKKNLLDLAQDPADFVDKQLTNLNEDYKPAQALDPEQWKKALAEQGKGLLEGETATAVLGKAFGPAGMAAAKASSLLSPMLVGAFRAAESKLLPSSLRNLKELIGHVTDTEAGKSKGLGSSILAANGIKDSYSVLSKISPPSLAKYGTEDFFLDPYLTHTVKPDNVISRDLKPKVLSLRGFLLHNSAMTGEVVQKTTFLDWAKNSGKYPEVYKEVNEKLAALGNRMLPDVMAFRDQIKDKYPLYEFETLPAVWDIVGGVARLEAVLEKSSYTPEQLSAKSVAQLLGIAKQIEAKQLKELSAITDFTKQRTMQLNKEQNLPPGFVELKTKQDLGAETEFMNNCAGAGGAHPQSGKFLPKWHPITGEQLIKDSPNRSSGDIYWDSISRGDIRMFSYRPEGLPEGTIRYDTRLKKVTEASGKANGKWDPKYNEAIGEFMDQLTSHGY